MNVTEDLNRFSGYNGLAYGLDTAIKALRPKSAFEVVSQSGKTVFTQWKDSTGASPPTDDEIQNELQYQKECSEWLKYSYDRKSEYIKTLGTPEEQLNTLVDLIAQGQNLQDSDWFKKVQSIKEKFPKPTEAYPTKPNK